MAEKNTKAGTAQRALAKKVPAKKSAKKPGDEDLLGQAKEAGQAAIELGKKAGRFAVNTVKKGVELAAEQIEKQKKAHEERQKAEKKKP